MAEWKLNEYLVTDENDRVDFEVVYGFISASYWARGIPREILERAIRNSVCFSLFVDGHQIGFARVTTDRATFAYLADVFVLPEHRGKGLSKFLTACVLKCDELQGLRRWVLVTRDAHTLYAQYGFKPLRQPEGYMELWDQEVYSRAKRGQE